MNASGTYIGEPPTILEGWLDGTSDKSGAFTGPLAGVHGSWLDLFSLLYVEGSTINFLTGDAPGTYDGSTFSISGPLNVSNTGGTIALTPLEGETLLDALKRHIDYGSTPQFFPYGPYIVSNSGIEITPVFFNWTAPYIISNEGKKYAAIGNIYQGSFSPTEGTSLPYLGYAGCCEYALGPLSYTLDSSNGIGTIDTSLQSIGEDYEIGPYIGAYSMRYLGVLQDVNDFRMAGAGTFVGTPANFFGNWGGAGDNYSLYYNYQGMMMLAGDDYGYFAGLTPPWTNPASFIAMGAYSLDPADKPHYLMNTHITGYTPKDVPLEIIGSLEGYAGAIWKGGDASTVGTISDGTLRAVYVSTQDGDGYVTAGVMKSDVSGFYYPFPTGPKMWRIDGTLTPTPYAAGLNPSDLYYTYGFVHGTLSGDFNGTGYIYGEAGGDTTFLYTSSQSLPFGIFNIKFGYGDAYNYYDYKPAGDPSWRARLGGFGVFDYDSGWIGYWLLTATGAWTDIGEITGSATGRVMTPLRLYDAEGRFSGINVSEGDYGEWIGQVIGSYYNGTSLAFFSFFDAAMLDAVNYDGIYFEYLSSLEGYLGGTASLWSGSDIPITIMGSVGAQCLWYTSTPIVSYNLLTEQYTTYDGGAYYGLAGGNEYAFKDIVSTKTLEGKFVALYIDNSATPKAGVLQAYLSGDIYPDINMFEMDGLANRTEKSTDIGLSASGLAYNINTGSLEAPGAYLSGTFNNGAAITGGENNSYLGATYAIATEPWGIYGLPMLGQFDTLATVPTSWGATVGSTGTFGAYKDASETVWGDWGYWLASITGTVPTGATTSEGILYGTLEGQYITYTRLGTMDGDVYGTYEYTGLWKAAALGTWTGTDLTFVSDVDVGLFHYSSAWDASDGWLYGLMGGTGTLWTGSPVAARMISQYNPGDGLPKIWNANIYSYNYKNNTYTTYDGGAYNGFFAGRVVGDDLYGRQIAIYISPQSGGKYAAGFLRGNFIGIAYPDIYMAEMIGLLITKPKNDDIGIAPESLTYSPWSFPPASSSASPPLWVGNNVTQPKLLWGKDTGWEIMSSGNAWNYTMALYNTTAHTAEPWGIYTMSHGGTVSGTPPAGWTGTVGGSGTFGAYYSTPQAAFYDDYGYYLTSISNGTWTGNEISGDVSGRFITSTKMGPMTGNLIGSYGAEADKWQAANIGVWEGSQLYFASSFAPYFEYFNGSEQKMTNDVFMNARFGSTGSLFAGGTPAFTAIGIQGMPNSYGHIWGQRMYSASPATGQYTTYDNGAYWSYLGGILYPCGGTGVRSMLGSWYGVYIAPSASSPYAAGYFTGNWTGPSYWYVGAFELDGTVAITQMTSDVGSIPGTGAITPYNFYEIVRKRYFAPDTTNLFVYGSFGSGEGYISGTTDLDTMSIPGQGWGVYMAKSGGWYSNPNSRTTWNTVTGGRAQFGSYNLDTMTGARYLGGTGSGYYGYSYFNSQAGRNMVGYVSYRNPDTGVGFERTYNANGYIGQQNFAYGDPYGRGRSYWYYAGGMSSPWTGDLATAIVADVPGDWTTTGTGPGQGQGAFYIADTTGTVNGVQLNGNESGTYMGPTTMGTFSGDLLGTVDSDTYQAISFGTWFNGSPLQFQNNFVNYVYYGSNPDGTYDTEDGHMWFAMGGTDPLFGAGTTVNATVMGEYVTGDPLLNHIWYTPMQRTFTSNNRIDGTNTTYDGGAYTGYAGATIIPGATTDAIDFLSYMMYVDGSSNTGVLYANIPGAGYPESMVFEGSGTIKRTQLGTGVDFAAKDLVANTQISTGPKTTDWGNYPPYGSTGSEGGFFDANYRNMGDMTNRWDRTEILSFTEPYNTTYGFGLWKTNSLGAYDPSITQAATGYHWNSDQIWTNASPFYLARYLDMGGYGTWSDGKFTSIETHGHWANWRSGRTALMAGRTTGAYNDSEGAFSAFSVGAWFGTPIYMSLAGTPEGRQALADLGFPSELTTTVTLSGSQPSLPGTNVNLPINIYSYATPPTSFAHKNAASNSISGAYSGQQIDYIGNIIVTNPGETFFASLWISQAAHSDSSNSDNWIGELWGSGAIQVDSSYIQGGINGFGAGQFTGLATTSGNFWGQFAGQFDPVWYMSWFTPNPSSKTTLYYYNGESVAEDGYFKGVFDGNGPLSLWTTSEAQSLDFHSLGIYKNNADVRTSPAHGSHIFSGEIFSMNYTNSTNTTLDGGAYWGQWVGIQRDFPSDGGGGKSIGGYLGGLAISPTGKVNGIFGRFGEVGEAYDYDNGWFDPINAQWQAGGEWYAVELGTSSVAPANLTSNIYNHTFYYNTGTSGGNFGGSGYIYMAPSPPQWAESSWISDSPYAGLWTTGFFGSWYDPSGGTAGWQYEIQGATSATTDLGVLIAGNPWADKKFEGNAVGYWASIEDITGTGVLSGRVLGTFDPSTYMAVGIGSWVETKKFLELAATEAGRNKLAQMHIPCVEVGNVTLIGSGNNFSNLSMNNVKFFAPTAGGKATVWATGSVAGTYTAPPALNTNIGLSSGAGITADFAFKNWNPGGNGKWIGAVTNGVGGFNGSTSFQGAAAGTGATSGAGTISGTAAGVAK